MKKSELISIIREEIQHIMEADKWIPSDMEKGALHKRLGIPEDDMIPMATINAEIAKLHKKSEGDKKLNADELKFMRQLVAAKNMKKIKK